MRLGNRRTVQLLRRAISVVWWLTWAVAVLSLVILPVWGQVTGEALTPAYDATVQADLAGEQTVLTRWGAARLYGTETTVEYATPPTWYALGSLAGWSVVFSAFLFFLYHLRELAMMVEAGKAFDAANTRRLRLLGSALLLSEIAEGGMMWWQSHVAVVAAADDASVRFGRIYEVDPEVLFAALVLFVLAEVFRRGTLLEEDQALTV